MLGYYTRKVSDLHKIKKQRRHRTLKVQYGSVEQLYDLKANYIIRNDSGCIITFSLRYGNNK